MLKGFFLTLFLCTAMLGVSAQCSSCATVKNFASDYCVTSPEFPGICAHFNTGADHFVIEGTGVKGGLKEIKLPDSLNLTAAWLIRLSNEKKVKLTVAEALLIQKAVPAWKSDKNFLNMQKTASGLEYKITKEGTGKTPEAGKKVYVNYRGTLLDGSEFDNSFKRGKPFSFNLGQGAVIKGWDEGIALLKVGGTALFRIPPALGYGERGYPPVIPPNSTLIFEVELVNAD